MDPAQRSVSSKESFDLPEINKILGLLELLKDRNGPTDIYKLSNELQMEFGEVLRVIRAAEVLHLVHTPGGDVVIEPIGIEICDAGINGKKQMINEQIRNLPVFKQVHEFLSERENGEASRDEIIEKLVDLVPNEDAEKSFRSLLNWGRYAELFGYNDDTTTVYLDSLK